MKPPRSRAKPKASTSPTSRQVISRQLRELIRNRELTAYGLGLRAGVDPGMIQRFLNEERDIRLDTLDRLADVLGLRLAEGSRGRSRPVPTRADRSGVAVPVARADQAADHLVEPTGRSVIIEEEPTAPPIAEEPARIITSEEPTISLGDPPPEVPDDPLATAQAIAGSADDSEADSADEPSPATAERWWELPATSAPPGPDQPDE